MKNDSEDPRTETEVIASWFTEQDVHEWLRARTALYGIKGLVLRISSDEPVSFSANVGLNFECGTSFDNAVALIRKVSPTPSTLRQQANALLKQAAELESANQQDDELRTEGKKSLPRPNIHE